MKTIIVIDISPPITYQAEFWFSSYGLKCCLGIELQDSLKCNISWKRLMMKFIFGMERNSKIFYKLILGVRSKNRKSAYLCNISRKTWGIKLLFCLQIYTKVFYIMLLSFWMCVSRLAQSSQNNKFVISLQYLKWNGKNEVGFILANKHQRFSQLDAIILEVVRHSQITQNNKFSISLQYLKKTVNDEVNLLHAYKHEKFLQIDTMIFDADGQAFPKFPNSEFAALLKYFKKEVRD